jgi:hypothetical protein
MKQNLKDIAAALLFMFAFGMIYLTLTNLL